MAQALYGDLPEDTKIAAQVKSKKALLKLAGAEPALQLAQLVALEHLLGVTLPERTKEVRTYAQARPCFFTSAAVTRSASQQAGLPQHMHQHRQGEEFLG